jgi:hypothetical protein
MIQTASWLLPKLPTFLMIAVATHLVMYGGLIEW